VTSSAAAITFTFGINQDLYRYIAVGLLVIVGLIVSLSPVVYQSFGKIEMVLVSVILIFLVFAIFKATRDPCGRVSSPKPPGHRGVPQDHECNRGSLAPWGESLRGGGRRQQPGAE
jgi:hypothetical protein